MSNSIIGSLFGEVGAETLDYFHGEEVWLIRESNYNSRVRYCNVYVGGAGLAGTNEVPGDGRVLNRPGGRSTRESYMFELPADAPLQATQDDHKPDVILWKTHGGRTEHAYAIKRVMGRDQNKVTVLAVRMIRDHDRNISRNG